MNPEFITARNGSPTCRYNGVLLHSMYSPEQEAERFVSSVSCQFVPSYLVITGPALSYCAPFFRKKFPHAALCAIRYDDSFSGSDSLWDKVFHASDPNLSESLYNALGEEGMFSAFFLPWQPSSRAFAATDRQVWNSIRTAAMKSRDVLYTRTVFSSRWVKNTFGFCRYITHAVSLEQGTCAVVITASGPSLRGCIGMLQAHRASFFLIAASSSLSVLAGAGIVPDLCISTDGGYYARKHLEPALRSMHSVPLALSCQSACPKRLLEQHDVLPLAYGDFPESGLLSACSIHAVHAEQNGTVSGTAAELALSITSGPVFMCGLDLSPSPGFQHTQPNILEQENAVSDTRIRTAETRTAGSRFSSQALGIYMDWFKALQPGKTCRLFRLSDGFRFTNTLGSIRDVGPQFFISSAQPGLVHPSFVRSTLLPPAQRTSEALGFLAHNSGTDEWLHSVFPADYLGCVNAPSDAEKESRRDVLMQKDMALARQIERMLAP